MKSYKDVKAQIAKLEKEAESLRQRELKTIIAQVRKVIEQYELTPSDLGLAGGAARGRPRKAGARKAGRTRASIGVAKYRDPASGKTWTGRGRPPTWMIGVKDPSAYLIDGASAPEAKPAKPARKAAAKKKGRPAAKAGRPAKSAKTTRAAKAGKATKGKRANGKQAAQPADAGQPSA